MRGIVRMIKQGYSMSVCVCVCLSVYHCVKVRMLNYFFYHKPVVVMKQLLFNLTRYACYLR